MRKYTAEEKITELYYLGNDPATGDVLNLMNVITYARPEETAECVGSSDAVQSPEENSVSVLGEDRTDDGQNCETDGSTSVNGAVIERVDTFMGIVYGDGIRGDLYVKVAEAGDFRETSIPFSYREYLAALSYSLTELLASFVRNIGEDENDAERYLRDFEWD